MVLSIRIEAISSQESSSDIEQYHQSFPSQLNSDEWCPAIYQEGQWLPWPPVSGEGGGGVGGKATYADPGMLESLGGVDTFSRVDSQHTVDQILGLWGDCVPFWWGVLQHKHTYKHQVYKFSPIQAWLNKTSNEQCTVTFETLGMNELVLTFLNTRTAIV